MVAFVSEVVSPVASVVIGLAALGASGLCLYLFYKDATKTPPAPEEIVAGLKAQLAGIDLDKLGTFAKLLADAFAKLGTGLSALLGALLFLLLSGEAVQVYHLTSGKECEAKHCTSGDDGSGTGNSADSGANTTTNQETTNRS